MVCRVCGSNINEGEVYCGTCGSKLDNTIVNSNPITPNNTVNNIVTGGTIGDYISDEELINAYIGTNADKLKNGGFSLNTFFFGVFYVFYRKMWAMGFIWLGVNILTMLFLNNYYAAIGIIMNIACSVYFKKLYMKHVTEEVNKIKNQYGNKTKEEMMLICSRKGGTTVLPIIVLIILYVLIIVGSIIIGAGIAYIFNSSNNKLGDLKVYIPNNFVKSEYSSDTFYIYTINSESKDGCMLTISKSENYSHYNNDAKAFLENRVYYTDSDEFTGIKSVNINGRTWYKGEVYYDSNDLVNYYYAILENDYFYEVEFRLYRNEDGTCKSALKEIEESLNF